MKIYADADALPTPIKDILCRAAMRRGISLVLVANKALRFPESPHITAVRVGQGFDVVDGVIVERVASGDLVITADIPLAAQVLEKDAHALNPRGERYSRDNIQGKLAMRGLLSELRDSGVVTGGPPPLSNRDREAFARELEMLLQRHGPERQA